MEKEINQYVSILIKNRKFRKKEYRCYSASEHDYYNFLNGKLNRTTTLLLLRKARHNKELQSLTHSLLYYCNADAVSFDLLNLIEKYPRKTRYSYYSSLVHCDLTFTQLWSINEKMGTEAFADLFAIICANDFYSLNDMRMLLENKNYSNYLLQCCIEDAEFHNNCISKIELAQKYLS